MLESNKKFPISLYKEGAAPYETGQVLIEMEATLDNLKSVVCALAPWSPAQFLDGKRQNSKLNLLSLLVLDFDSGMTLDEAQESFKDYSHIVATTKSHRKQKNGVACDRFRVLLTLDQPITKDSDYKKVWAWAESRWPSADPQCKDSARFFYPCVDIISYNPSGISVLVNENRLEAQKIAPSPKNRSNSNNKGRLSRATSEFLIHGAPPGSWHGALFKAAVDFKEQGYDYDTALVQLQKATQSENGDGDLDDKDLACILDVFDKKETKYSPRTFISKDDWPVQVRAKNGDFYPDLSHPDNYNYALDKMNLNLSYNTFVDVALIDGRPQQDHDVVRIFDELCKFGLRRGKDYVTGKVEMRSRLRSFDPVKEFIEAEKWDGVDHLGALFRTLELDLEEEVEGDRAALRATYEALFRKWFIGVAAKIYKPGSQNFVLTLLGDQGIGKSTWLSKLLPVEDIYGEGPVDPMNKDHLLIHSTKLIWHISELESTTTKRETFALKDYLTKSIINVREAYGRKSKQARSVCSFCASLNSSMFLMDETGNRRFVTLRVKRVEFEARIDYRQLWSQVVALYRAEAPWWLSGAEGAFLAAQNEGYIVESRVKQALTVVRPGDKPISVVELLAEVGIDKPTKGDITEAGMFLKKRHIKSAVVYSRGLKKKVFLVSPLLQLPTI